MCTEQKIPLEAFYIIISILCHMVYLPSKSLHLLDDKNNQISQKTEVNRLETNQQLLNSIDNEIKRWEDILYTDFNNWRYSGNS